MTDFTRKHIKENFLLLLEELPLNEITIKKIVEKCGINRNTFYYHYDDIPALLEEIIKEEADNVIQKYPSVHSIPECCDALADFAGNRKRAIMHIYSSIRRDIFEQSLMKVSKYFVKCYIDTLSLDDKISALDKEAIINYYKSLCFGLVIDWLNNGMKDEDAKNLHKIIELKQKLSLDVSRIFE